MSSPLKRHFQASLCLLMIGTSSTTMAQPFESLENIANTAITYAENLVDEAAYTNVSINTDNLDQRLKLPQCSRSLNVVPAGSNNNPSRFIVGVQCQGEKPWKVYVPVNIDATIMVATSNSTLPRGTILSETDISLEEHSIQQLPLGYLSKLNKIKGMELTRQLNSGTIITNTMIKPRQLVKRGQEVTILAIGDNIEIRMNGTAKANGAKGEWIPIENRTSGRNIEAMVVSEQVVKVKM